MLQDVVACSCVTDGQISPSNVDIDPVVSVSSDAVVERPSTLIEVDLVSCRVPNLEPKEADTSLEIPETEIPTIQIPSTDTINVVPLLDLSRVPIVELSSTLESPPVVDDPCAHGEADEEEEMDAEDDEEEPLEPQIEELQLSPRGKARSPSPARTVAPLFVDTTTAASSPSVPSVEQARPAYSPLTSKPLYPISPRRVTPQRALVPPLSRSTLLDRSDSLIVSEVSLSPPLLFSHILRTQSDDDGSAATSVHGAFFPAGEDDPLNPWIITHCVLHEPSSEDTDADTSSSERGRTAARVVVPLRLRPRARSRSRGRSK